ANAFALMGLRQLYFLIGGLLDRLVHLSAGLACVLGFIGVKLILEALHTNELPFLNGGRPLPVPVIGTAMSLAVVASILVATVGASVAKATLCAKSRQEPVEPAPEQGESVGADRR
ncbi:MAG: TerC family protein, partial [Kutzneria sp.]|nr:TerC family protein [Kutzneria sp.]